MKAELIIPIDVLRGKLNNDGYLFVDIHKHFIPKMRFIFFFCQKICIFAKKILFLQPQTI